MKEMLVSWKSVYRKRSTLNQDKEVYNEGNRKKNQK